MRVGALLLVFCAAWLPFYRDWRWVASGDSLGWFEIPAGAVERQWWRSVLSVRGAYDQFTYTQVIVDNVLMFVFGPTFFWHRASKLLVSILGLAAVAAYFSMLLRSPWAIAVMLATATNFIWVLFSYVSYNHIDSYLWAYATLIVFTLVVRQPEQRAWWVLLGTVAGFSLFFTQTAWAEVAACGIAVTLWALITRRWRALIQCGVSSLVAGFPVLLQAPLLMKLSLYHHSQPVTDWNYLWRMFWAIFSLPLGSAPASVGFYSHFFFWPCGPLYLAGLALAAISVVSPLRKRLGLSIAVVGLLLLYFWDVALFAVTNNGYPSPSPKRTYHLVALQAFFCLLPLYCAASVTRRFPLVSRGITAATFLGIGAYAAVNLSMFVLPEPRFGGTIKDAMVQVRQRFADHKVLILDRRSAIRDIAESPRSVLNLAYELAENISVVSSLDPVSAAEACRTRTILCRSNYAGDGIAEEFAAATEFARDQFHKIQLYGIRDLDCFECTTS